MFIRRLQRDVNRFQDGWNQQRMRSVKSPYQLYISGILQNASRGHRGVDDLFCEPVADEADDVENYGIDFDEPAPEEDADRVMSSIESLLLLISLFVSKNSFNHWQSLGFCIYVSLNAVSFCTLTEESEL